MSKDLSVYLDDIVKSIKDIENLTYEVGQSKKKR